MNIKRLQHLVTILQVVPGDRFDVIARIEQLLEEAGHDA